MEIDLGPCAIRSWRVGDEGSLVRHADDREVWINLRDRSGPSRSPAPARR